MFEKVELKPPPPPRHLPVCMDIWPYCSQHSLCYLDLFFVLLSLRLALFNRCKSLLYNLLALALTALSLYGASSACLLFALYAAYIHTLLPSDMAALIESTGRVINIIFNVYATVALVITAFEAFGHSIISPTPTRLSLSSSGGALYSV